MTRFIQITDSHVGADSTYRLAGINTQASFEAVLDAVKQDEFDHILATGDLAAEANIEAYHTFFDRMAEFEQPMNWLPGNHDLIDIINQMENASTFVQSFDVENWQIIMLDSVIKHQSNGRLGEQQLKMLEVLLAEGGAPNVMICLHHQPVDVGCAWLDRQKIEDAEQFLHLVENNDRVKAVLWGHVHQEYSENRNGKLFISTPSTCVQFKTNSDDFALDDLYPGYRIIELSPDGNVVTEVKRVAVKDFNVDVDCVSY